MTVNATYQLAANIFNEHTYKTSQPVISKPVLIHFNIHIGFWFSQVPPCCIWGRHLFWFYNTFETCHLKFGFQFVELSAISNSNQFPLDFFPCYLLSAIWSPHYLQKFFFLQWEFEKAVFNCVYLQLSKRIHPEQSVLRVIKREGRSQGTHRVWKSFHISAICVSCSDAGQQTVFVSPH